MNSDLTPTLDPVSVHSFKFWTHEFEVENISSYRLPILFFVISIFLYKIIVMINILLYIYILFRCSNARFGSGGPEEDHISIGPKKWSIPNFHFFF